ncbi:HNH endonuclease [Flavobacteriaceae bacterium]|nr:HNH endonuclease [Flavobacteriaceae bacterium]
MVEPTNPTLADQARKKYQEYTDDEIVVTFEVEVNEGKKKKRSRRISQDVKDKVWRRDEGKCVECGSNENLEFDHIIPHSKEGANTYRNIQLLCEKGKRSKSAKIV